MFITTATGKKYKAQRCYYNDSDGNMHIGLWDISVQEVAPVFCDPVETETIISNKDGEEHTFNGFTSLELITRDTFINGVQIVLRKQAIAMSE